MTAHRFDHRPGAILNSAALALAIVVVVLAGSTSTIALGASLFGLVGLSIGVTGGFRRVAAIGALSMLSSVVVAGASGVVPVRLLPSVGAAVLAWEFGVAGQEMQRELAGGTVAGSEVRHVIAALGAGGLTVVVALTIYQMVIVETSLLGVTLLFGSATFLGLALRE